MTWMQMRVRFIGRVYIGTFASNIGRLIGIMKREMDSEPL
jgi:hypothetical protein